MSIFAPEFHFFWLMTVVFLGLCLGSFAGALAYRLPRNIPITGRRRSACPSCGATLGIADLVPVFSWIFNRGKCRHCTAAVSADYLMIEVMTLALALAFFHLYGYQAVSLILIFSAPVISAMFFIDLRHMIIPDRLNMALGAAGLLMLGIISFTIADYKIPGLWQQAVVGALMFFAIAYFLTWLMSIILKKQAMGGGDIKFFAVAGLWLGPMILPFYMMVAGGLGVLFGLVSKKMTGQDYFPFGPALIAAFVLCLLLKKTVF